MDFAEAENILSGVMLELREERDRQGLSLQQLGALSGVNRTTIGLIEQGKRSPSLVICLRVADALSLRLGDLVNSAQSKDGEP